MTETTTETTAGTTIDTVTGAPRGSGEGRPSSEHAASGPALPQGARVVVTGASGLLGGSVARRLVQEGYAVTTFQRGAAGIPGAREVRGSLTDAEAVRDLMQGQDALVHMAAKVSVSGELRDFVEVNVRGTQRILDAAEAAGVRDVLHVSSPSVAHSGDSLVGVGAQPADPAHAVGHYARTKAESELLALDRERSGMRVLVLRPHLVWGPGDGQLTRRIVQRAQSGRMPILGSGAALVDTIYIDNAVDAFAAALRRLPAIHGQSLVLTNGEPRPIGELITGMARAGGAPAPRLRIPPRLAMVAGWAVEKVWALGEHDDEPPMTRFLAEQLSTAHWFDQRQTRSALAWTPRISIDDGFAALAEHVRQTGGV